MGNAEAAVGGSCWLLLADPTPARSTPNGPPGTGTGAGDPGDPLPSTRGRVGVVGVVDVGCGSDRMPVTVVVAGAVAMSTTVGPKVVAEYDGGERRSAVGVLDAVLPAIAFPGRDGREPDELEPVAPGPDGPEPELLEPDEPELGVSGRPAPVVPVERLPTMPVTVRTARSVVVRAAAVLWSTRETVVRTVDVAALVTGMRAGAARFTVAATASVVCSMFPVACSTSRCAVATTAPTIPGTCPAAGRTLAGTAPSVAVRPLRVPLNTPLTGSTGALGLACA
jgi:hypothetical protein